MARFSRLKTLTTMIDIGLVPVFYNSDIEVSKNILKACAEGGAKVVEMTNRGDGAINVFKSLEEYCRSNYPNIILGAGSIVDAPTAALYIANGANFIVGPSMDRDTALLCNRRKIPYSPGCGSATEIQVAHELGVEIVKVFPGDLVGGPSFVEAMLGPCPWTLVMPTGGVDTTEESLIKWFSSGVACVGIGSKLIKKEEVKTSNFDKIAADIKRVTSLIKKIRSELSSK